MKLHPAPRCAPAQPKTPIACMIGCFAIWIGLVGLILGIDQAAGLAIAGLIVTACSVMLYQFDAAERAKREEIR